MDKDKEKRERRKKSPLPELLLANHED